MTNKSLMRISTRELSPAHTTSNQARPQTAEGWKDPHFSFFAQYMPLQDNLGLYRVIRETIPFIDSAIVIRKMLLGKFEPDTGGQEAMKGDIQRFIDGVPVNWYSQGLWAFMREMHDSADALGYGVGEFVPLENCRDIHRLKTCRSESVTFVEEDNRLRLATYRNGCMRPIPVEDESKMSYLAYDTRDGHPQGKSLIYSCVVASQTFVRWMKSFDNYLYRFGDPSLYTTVNVDKDSDLTQEQINVLSDNIQKALIELNQNRRAGKTGDIAMGVKGGKIEHGTLGSDAAIGTQTDYLRTILEAIFSKTQLPPWMLAVNWTHSEKLSQMQQDSLATNIKQQRTTWEPILKRIIDTWLIMQGYRSTEWKMVWEEPTIYDEFTQARADYFNARAAQQVIENTANMILMGWLDPKDGEDYLRSMEIIKCKPQKDWYKKTKEFGFMTKIISNTILNNN